MDSLEGGSAHLRACGGTHQPHGSQATRTRRRRAAGLMRALHEQPRLVAAKLSISPAAVIVALVVARRSPATAPTLRRSAAGTRTGRAFSSQSSRGDRHLRRNRPACLPPAQVLGPEPPRAGAAWQAPTGSRLRPDAAAARARLESRAPRATLSPPGPRALALGGTLSHPGLYPRVLAAGRGQASAPAASRWPAALGAHRGRRATRARL